ncbi:hypothetical protein ACVWYF_003621 [Hymenobacter sp. UYAg731]
MRYRLLLFLLLLLPAWAAKAQAPNWQTVLGNSATVIRGSAANASGDYYVIGTYNGTLSLGGTAPTLTSVGGSEDMFLAKFSNSSNSFVWAVSGGGSGTEDGRAVAVNGSNVYVTGTFAGTATISGTGLTDASGSGSGQDMYVAKYVDNGTTVSNGGALSGGGGGSDQGLSIAVNGTSIYVSGFLSTSTTPLPVISGSTLTGAGSQDMFVARFNDSGTLTNGSAVSSGGASLDRALAIGVNGNGVYVTGYFTGAGLVTISGTALTGTGGQDMYVAKYTATLGNAGAVSGGSTTNDQGQALTISANNIYVAGTFTGTASIAGSSLTSTGLADMFVAKYTDSGSGLTNGFAARDGGANTEAVGDIAVTGNTLYVVGNFTTSTTLSGSSLTSNGLDAFVAKYTDQGSSLANLGAIDGGNDAPGTGTSSANTISLSGAQALVAGAVATPATFGSIAVASGTAYVAKLAPASTTLTSIALGGSSPTNATSVTYTVTFASSITGLSVSNFSLTATGTVAGATVTSVTGSGTTYTVTVNTGTGDGTLRLNLANDTGLSLTISNSPYTSGPAYTIDKTAPTVAITSSTAANGGTSGSATFAYTVTFSENVNASFVAGDVTVTNGTISGFTTVVPGTTFTFNVTPTANGVVSVTVPANVAQDAAGNFNTAGTPAPYSITYSQPVTAAPVVTTPGNGSLLNTTTPTYSGTAVAASTVTVYVDGSAIGTTTATAGGTFSLNQPTALAQGSHTVRATAQTSGSAVSVNSNTNTFTVDTVQPTVAISSTTGTSGSTTNTSPIPFTVTFSEAVTGFVAGDVTVSNGTISGFTAVSGTVYTFNVTPTTPGTATTVTIPANVAQDAASNGNTASPGAYSITYNIPSTTVSSVTRLTPSPTATAQVSYRVVFAASVTGVTVSNFSVNTLSTAISGASVSSVSGSGTTYTVTVNTGTGNGSLRLEVANSTGITPTVSNVPYTAGELYAITKSFAAAPQLTIVGTGGTGSDVTAFVDVVQVLSGGSAFANALQNGSFETHDPLANGDFGYNPTGAGWAFNTRSGIAEQGSAFTPPTPIPNGIAVAFVQSTGGGNGQLQQTLALPTGSSYQVSFQAAQRVCCTTLDQALNVFLNGVYLGTIQPGSSSYSTFTSPTFAVTAPALTAIVSTTSSSPTSTSPIPFSVSFSQSVGTTFTASDVTVTGGTLNSPSFAGSGSGPYTFTVTPSGTGTVTVSLAANVVNDANNTQNTASNAVSVQYVQLVTAAPVVNAPANGSLTNTTTPTYTGTAVANSTVTVYVDGSAIGTTTADGTGNFSLNQPTALAQGSHTVRATAQTSGSAVSANSTTNTFTVDTVQPTVAITSTTGASGSTSGNATFAYTVTFSEAVTGFVAGDVTVTNGTISGFTAVSGTVYTFNVTPAANGPVTVNVPANVAQDAAGNGNTGAASAYSITYAQPVTAAPVVTAPANGSQVSTTTPTYAGTAVANSTVTVYVDGTSIGTTTADGAGSFTLAQPTALAQGSHTVRATAQTSGSAVSVNSTTNTFTVDTVQPTVAISSTAGASGSNTTTTPIPFTVTFSEAVTGFVAGDVTVTNGTIGTVSGSGTTYTFNVTPTTAGTATTVNVPANVAQDGAGNGNTAASSAYSLTYQPTAVTWNGSISGDWFTAGNWTPAVVPTTAIDATIPASAPNMPAISAGTASVKALTINSGATVSHSGGTLDVRANLTNNGTYTATGGTMVLGTSTLANILGSSNTRFWNLTIGANGAQSSTSASTSVLRLLTLNGALTTNGNPLTLESNATGTALVYNTSLANVIVGNVTVQRYIAPDLNLGLGYRHFSSPVSTATVGSLAIPGGFTPVVNPNYNTSNTPNSERPFPTVYYYDQSRLATSTNLLAPFDKGWTSPSALTDPLTVGRGYTVNLTANQTLSVTGPQNNGTVSQSLARTTAFPIDAGWQLLGNPYPSPLDYSLVAPFDRIGLDAALYVFESTSLYGGTYRANVNGVGGNANSPNAILAQGQGFVVRVSNGQTSGQLILRNTHRVTAYQNPVYHRTVETRSLVQLDLQSATGSDPLYVYFENGATAGVDQEMDAVKLPNTTGLNLAAWAGSDKMAINALPLNATASVTVPLFIGLPVTGTYTLHAAQVLNFGAGEQPFLRDVQLGTLTDLSLHPDYTFTMNAANTTTRFELVFGARVLGVASAKLAAQVAVYPNPASKAVFVELPYVLNRKAVTAALVDALGRVVLTQALPAGQPTYTLPLTNLATGVYSLRLQTEAGVVVKKLVVE